MVKESTLTICGETIRLPILCNKKELIRGKSD